VLPDLLTLAEFEAQIKQWIPLASDLQFTLQSFEDNSITLTAPFEKNRNDKNTVFAGSQASLALLAGWSLATLSFNHCGVTSVAAMQTEMSYLKPIRADVLVKAVFAEEANIEACENILDKKGRAKISVLVELFEQGSDELKSKFTGTYFLGK